MGHRVARRGPQALSIAVVLCAVVSLLNPTTATAHVPILEQPNRDDAQPGSPEALPRAQGIPSPVRSLAVYGYLARDESFDSYLFEVPRTVVTRVELLVPVRTGLGEYRPTLALFAEGSSRRQVLPAVEPAPSFYEPFSIASFWRVAESSVTLQPDEDYAFIVEPGQGEVQSGPYVIAVGGPEAFEAADWLATPLALPRIWLGSWGGGPVRPGLLACCVLGLLVLPVGYVLIRRRRRRRFAAR